MKYLNGVSYLLTPTYLTLFMLLCVPSTDSSTRLEISWVGVGDRSLGGGEFPVARARDGDRMRAELPSMTGFGSVWGSDLLVLSGD